MTYDSKHTEIIGPKEGYDAVAQQYGQYHKHLNSFYTINFLQFFPRKKSFDIIDLGAGDGRMWYQLKDIPHEKYLAVDISKEMLARHPRGAKHLVADLEKPLPLESDSFDVAVSFFTLEHLERLEVLFSEVYRILRPEGQLFIGHFFQRRMFERNTHSKRFKIQQYPRSTEEILQEGEYAGFAMETVKLFDKEIQTGDLIIGRKK